jgi:hypothetical protein
MLICAAGSGKNPLVFTTLAAEEASSLFSVLQLNLQGWRLNFDREISESRAAKTTVTKYQG